MASTNNRGAPKPFFKNFTDLVLAPRLRLLRTMMRVHTERDEKGGLVLRLEGSLIGPWIAEFTRVLEAVPEGALAIDLSALIYADKRGEQLLRDLAARAEVRGCSPFVAELLRGSKEP